MDSQEFTPKLFGLIRGYSWGTFRKDLFAGCTVGVISLPLAMAFAIASGVEPIRGLYTAMIAGFLISFLGGSRVQIGGPTGAFIIIVYDIVQRTGYEGLCISTVMASVVLILLGIFRVGSLIQYIPRSLIVGFTTGLGLFVFSTQIKDFFGLQMGTPPASFLTKWIAYGYAFPSLNSSTTLLALGTLGLIFIIQKFFPRIPWGITTIACASTFAILFHLPVDTIATRFGTIPGQVPFPQIPNFSMLSTHFPELVKDALVIAFLGGIESLLSAVIGDEIGGGKHRPNCELIAQGIANASSIFFGGIPATGAIARTAANVKTGAQTPVAGIIHSIILALLVFCFAPIISQIPLAILSAVLVIIAWNMSEAHHFFHLLKGPLNDRIVLLSAFFLTVFVDITIAISISMLLACLIFIKQIFQKSSLIHTTHLPLNKMTIPSSMQMYEIQGPFFFASTNLLKSLFFAPRNSPNICILRLGKVPIIDASGAHAILTFHKHCQAQGVTLYLSEIQESVKKDLKHFHVLHTFGEMHILSTLQDVIDCVQLHDVNNKLTV